MSRSLWMAAGALFFALGWIGLILPMMPGFVFFLAAAFCFARGNPVWEQRMLDNPRLGPPLRDWRERRAISRKAKRSAVTAMAVAGVIAWVIVGFPWAIVSIGAMIAVALWLWTRPE